MYVILAHIAMSNSCALLGTVLFEPKCLDRVCFSNEHDSATSDTIIIQPLGSREYPRVYHTCAVEYANETNHVE